MWHFLFPCKVKPRPCLLDIFGFYFVVLVQFGSLGITCVKLCWLWFIFVLLCSLGFPLVHLGLGERKVFWVRFSSVWLKLGNFGSLGFTWVDFVSNGYLWFKLAHLDLLGLLGFAFAHIGSLWLTWVHLVLLLVCFISLGLTWICLGSLCFQSESLRLTWVHLDSFKYLGSLWYT